MTSVWRFAPYVATTTLLVTLAFAFEASYDARQRPTHRWVEPAVAAEPAPVPEPVAKVEPPPPAHACELLGASGEHEGVHFEARLPRDEDAPTIVMLHGRGQSPATMQTALADFDYGGRILYPRGFVPSGHGWRWMKARTRHPDFGDDLRDDIIHLTDFMVEVEACFGPFVIAGHSQGGHIAYALAATMPNRLLAAVGTSGTLPPEWDPGSFRLPVVAIHGRRDPIVPFSWTERMIEERGGRLRAIDGRHHRLVGPIQAALHEELRAIVEPEQSRDSIEPLSATDHPSVCSSARLGRARVGGSGRSR